jgi:heptaprenyl diphosphate synthase
MKSLRKIQKLAKQYLEYDMITKTTTLPAFPTACIRLVLAFLSAQRTPHRELYALVTALVQIGLDTHEHVGNQVEGAPALSLREMRRRQIDVLAGDYLSSRYYQLLDEAGQIKMIRKIARQVSIVNQTKMTLYGRMRELNLTAAEYLELAASVKTGLFDVFTPFMPEREQNYTEALHNVGRCEVVLDELSRMHEPELFIGSWGYWFVLQEGSDEERAKLRALGGQQDTKVEPARVAALLDKYNIQNLLTGLLDQSIGHIKMVATRMEGDHPLIAELVGIAEQFLTMPQWVLDRGRQASRGLV